MSAEEKIVPRDEYIGFLKYQGNRVESGIMDARSAARALMGLDRSLRYFVTQDFPVLTGQEFEIPVKIEKGSWVALIPQTIEQWIMAGAGLAAAAYVTTAAKKMAEKDFKEVGLRDAFRWALQAIQWTIRLGKHLGSTKMKEIKGLRWTDNEVLVPNSNGEILRIPREVFRAMAKAPNDLISEMASVVDDGRTLSLAVNCDSGIIEDTITKRDRGIFCVDHDDLHEVLFPEFFHGMHVNLEGLVTRGNGVSNSIGFMHDGHILTCTPNGGNVVKFKGRLFLPSRIVGTISRYNPKTKKNDDPRPRIIFDDLLPIKDPPQEPGLFDR